MGGYLERLKSQKAATRGTAKTAKRGFGSKDSDRGRHISEIPAPEPAGMGPVYAELWKTAWRLADEIDDVNGAPLAERLALMPELNALRYAMSRMEQGLIPEHWFIVDAVKALYEIRATKYPKSKTLESVALILEGTPEKLPKKQEAFVYAIGKAIKPVLAQVEKTARPKLAREVADFFRLAEDGHPITKEDVRGNG